MTNAAIPMLCREALEATAWDVYSAKALTAGSSRTDVEDAWEEAQGVKKRIALALDGDGAFAKWTSGGPWRKAAMKVATAGIHGTAGDYKAVVNEVRRATRDLQS